MRSTKSYSNGLKELRLKLGIKPPPAQTETDERAAAFKQRVKEVVQKSRKRKIANDRMRGPIYRWTPEEDLKLWRLRSSGKELALIAKELHRSRRAVRYRFLRLLQKRNWP